MKRILMSYILIFCLSAPVFANSSLNIQLNDIVCKDSTAWIGTSEGLFTIRTTDGVMSYLTPIPNEDFGVYCTEQAPDGSLWINGNNLNVMWHKDGQWSALGEDDIGLPQDGPWFWGGILDIAFHQTSPQPSPAFETWFANGFNVFHYDGISTTPYSKFEWGIHSSFPVFDLAIDSDGSAWSVGFVGLVHYLLDGTIVEDPRYQGYSGRNLIIDENGVFWIASYEDGLVRIEGDAVHIFTPDNSDIPSHEVIDLAFDADGLLWVLTGSHYGDPTAVSSFDGETWTVYDGSDIEWFDRGPKKLAIDQDGTKWIGTSFDGVVSFDGSEWTHYDLTGALPTSVKKSSPSPFELLPAYPNPFNASATIPFTLQEPGHVTLSVYSVTGQCVATLIDRSMTVGAHQIMFDGEELSSGMYISRLESAGLVKTERMVLVK